MRRLGDESGLASSRLRAGRNPSGCTNHRWVVSLPIHDRTATDRPVDSSIVDGLPDRMTIWVCGD